MENEYFAGLPTKEIGAKLNEKVDDYYKYLNSTSLLRLWRLVHEKFYYGYYSRGEVEHYGKQGEKVKIHVNHFKSLLDNIKVMTTNQRPSFDPRAVNSDYKSQAQALLAKGLLDYYMRQEKLEDIIDGCVDFSLQSGEGWIFQEWNPDVGKVVGKVGEKETQINDEEEEEDVEVIKEKREGNINSEALHPIDIIRDIYVRDVDKNNWYIVRRPVNKFDLAARYPKFEEEIVDSTINASKLDNYIERDEYVKLSESDLTYLYTFRHKKTASLPEGRQVEFLDDDTVLFDGDLPYSDISLYRLMPNKRKKSNFGYTVAFDLLAIQEAVNTLESTSLTNQSTFGVQNIAIKKGGGVTCEQLTGGLNVIEYNGEKPPEVLKLLNTAAEVFNSKQDYIQQMETISGVNSVSRGNPEASLKSGAALALVQSMAIQFNSGLQHSYAQLLEALGTGTISMLRDYAKTKRVALIAGISNKSYLKEFKGTDLEKIDRVVVDMGNPLSKTLAGRLQIGDTLVERGLVNSPDQYLQIIETGTLQPMVEGKEAEIMNIRSENEMLSNKKQVFAVFTDNHHLHIKEHKNVLASPDSRKEVGLIERTMNHINEHLHLLRTVDP